MDGDRPAEPISLRGPNRTTLVVRSGRLAGPVLSRTVSILAARADLPLDRLNDAVLVADAIAAHAPVEPEDRISVAIDTAPRDLSLRVGPLRDGGARKLLATANLPAAGNVIDQLADQVDVRSASGGGEYLLVRLAYDSGHERTETGPQPA